MSALEIAVPCPPVAHLTWQSKTVSLTPAEFFHLRDCFGTHGFQPDTEGCALCRAIGYRLGWFDD